MLKLREKKLFYITLAGVFIPVCMIFLRTNTFSDSGDGVVHYLFSKYSWKHPHLFFDLWAKPVFTFLSSPFSQFGISGIKLFQIVCAFLSCLFSYKIAEAAGMKNKWLFPVLLCSAPMYFMELNTGLTEPFFGCFLLASIYLTFSSRYYAAAFVFSFRLL